MTKTGSLTNIPESTTVTREIRQAGWLRKSRVLYLKVEVESHAEHVNWVKEEDAPSRKLGTHVQK